ncbi:Syd protein [Streptomyces sp. NBRC 110611]|uniref:hypothetical protein n=1 Tax=Streptomyces sp. NBRC 110611 TaxID=1621259 RepID=UPI000836E5AC|nr:hypothetical protein [Streptomyces sp. NBRC 110611]GAU64853.1 Syd protein [Streptomyces sp. NBRC 110611]
MTSPIRYSQRPVELPLDGWLVEEELALSCEKCTECAELERGRKQAEAEGDFSRVTDFNVLIVRHRMTHSGAS